MSEQFKSTFIDVKNKMEKINKNVTFASIDLGEHGEIEKDYLVLEIPMLKLFKKERHYDFHGKMSLDPYIFTSSKYVIFQVRKLFDTS